MSGVSGREARGSGAAGALILSRGSPPARGFGGDAPCSDPVGGTGRGRGGRWAGPGRGARVAAQLGPGGFGPRVQWGGKACSFFLLTVLFSVFSYLFISFFVLFHLKVFRHFIKMCFLHHNYQCII